MRSHAQRTCLIAIAALCAVPGGARAQSDRGSRDPDAWENRDALVTDRPDFTESAVTVYPRHVQVELGYTAARVGDVTEHSVGEILIRLGLAERLEARIGLNSFAWVAVPGNDPEGREDVSLGAKVNLLRARPGSAVPDVGILLSALLPTGAGELGQGSHLLPVAILAAGLDATEWLSAGANFGWGYLDDGAGRYSQFTGSVALGFSLSPVIGAYAEYFALLPELDGGPDGHFLNGGFTFLISRDLQADIRAGFSVDDAETGSFGGAGFAFRI
jgi:hypothetical protein